MTIQEYQQIRPCIDQHGHKFAANLVRVVVCERCGMTRLEATQLPHTPAGVSIAGPPTTATAPAGLTCTNHKPAQHRDGKPPWCPTCGLTAGFTEPVSLLSAQLPVSGVVEATHKENQT